MKQTLINIFRTITSIFRFRDAQRECIELYLSYAVDRKDLEHRQNVLRRAGLL